MAIALLAAGRGTRFGGSKLTADLAGRPLWTWAAHAAESAGFARLLLVTNDPSISRSGWTVMPSPDAAQGIAGSVRAAVAAARDARRLIIALADMPFVPAEHLCALAEANGVALTEHGTRPGVPAGFPARDFPRLMALSGDRGAAALDWPNAVLLDPTDPDAILDVDDAAALERARGIALKRWPGVSR